MAMRELVNPIADLFDAAVRHMTVQLRCPRCGWTAHFDPHAMWWLFDRKGWDDRISQVVPISIATHVDHAAVSRYGLI